MTKNGYHEHEAAGVRGRQGFSLVEIMIAIVIFAIGVIAVMYLFPMGVRDIGKAKELTAATYLGQAKMEEALINPAVPPEGSFPSPYDNLYFTVSRLPFQNRNTMVIVSVEVYKLLDSSTRKRLVRLDTLKSTGGYIENN